MDNKITNLFPFIDTKEKKKKYRVTTFCDMVETYVVLARNKDEAEDIVLSGSEAPDQVSYQDEKIEFIDEIDDNQQGGK
jgi:hypothetical protein